jgi:hypothetical protein
LGWGAVLERGAAVYTGAKAMYDSNHSSLMALTEGSTGYVLDSALGAQVEKYLRHS